MLKLVPWRWREREACFSLGAFRGKLDGLFRRSTVEEASPWPERSVFSPAVDLSETEKEIIVKAELPGIDPNRLDIGISGRTLTINGEKKDQKEEKGEHFHRVERSFGSFAISLVLPCSVQEDEIRAEYKDGVLLLKLPKAEPAEIGQDRLQVPRNEEMMYMG